MKELRFKVLGTPTPKQSFRYAVRPGKGGKNFVSKYQPKEVTETTRNVAWDIKSQIPQGFIPFDCPLGIQILFVFPAPSGWSKKKSAELIAGTIFYKDTKPDLDNCEKLYLDSMQGVVYLNDSRICKKDTIKIYGQVPRVEIFIYELDTTNGNIDLFSEKNGAGID